MTPNNMIEQVETTEQENDSKGNPYETFRETIKAVVVATVVKVRDTSVSFNWSLGKIISACAEACKQPLTATPENFKRIVKFEFGKLRTSIATNPDFELIRSKEDYILNDGEMKARLTNTSHKIIALDKQLLEARKMYSRLGDKMVDETISAEKRSTIRKRMNKVIVVIDHVTAEIERQIKLQSEVTTSEPK